MNALVCSAALAAAFLLAGCGDSKQATGASLIGGDVPGVITGAAGTNSPWLSVSETVQCPGIEPDNCPGGFGFTVRPDGVFVAGPPPGSVIRVTNGMISASELVELRAAADPLVQGLGNESQSCDKGSNPPGASDSVTLTVEGSWPTEVYTHTSENLCTRGAGAARLHELMHRLLTKYYPSHI